MKFVKSIAAFVALVLSFACAAQPYPSRPIRFVVPFPPGGTIDAYARALARQVESWVGQPIVIDKRPGANGILGADTVAKAAPDGYTLLDNAASFVINASMCRKLPYDAANDFTPITNFVRGLGYLLVAHPSVPANSVRELIELAKKKPGARGIREDLPRGYQALRRDRASGEDRTRVITRSLVNNFIVARSCARMPGKPFPWRPQLPEAV